MCYVCRRSWLKGDNGDDMLWNPTSNLFTGISLQETGNMEVSIMFMY